LYPTKRTEGTLLLFSISFTDYEPRPKDIRLSRTVCQL
jgi:hypothetical protein